MNHQKKRKCVLLAHEIVLIASGHRPHLVDSSLSINRCVKNFRFRSRDDPFQQSEIDGVFLN